MYFPGCYRLRNNSDPIFNHMTVAYNSSGFDDSGVYLRDDSNLLVLNSIFWENGESQFYFRDSGDDPRVWQDISPECDVRCDSADAMSRQTRCP